MIDEKLKHLEFIQVNIQRMNQNSFLIKGWAITLVSALFALAAKDSNKNYVLVTYICIPIFWGLDAYYLSVERGFRKLYKLALDGSVKSLEMNPRDYLKGEWLDSITSKTILPVYVCLICIPILIMFAKGF